MSISLGNTSISNAYLGSSGVSAIYLGGTQVWNSVTATIGPDTFFLGGAGGVYTQAQIVNRLIGETITYFVSASGNLYISSSTPFTIDNATFQYINLTSVRGGSSCTAIGQAAFQNTTNLKSAIFSNATTMGTFAFIHATNLITASFPVLTAIPFYAFNDTGVISGSFPLVTSIGASAFENSRITTANFPSVLTMGNSAFQSSGIITASFPVLTGIPDQAFNQSYFASGSFPSATSIGSQAFRASNIVSASFPSVKTIGANAFQYSVLQSASFPALSGSNAIGGSPDYNYVFEGVAAYTGSLTVPSDYLTNNGSRADADLQYLMGFGDAGNDFCWDIDFAKTDTVYLGGNLSTISKASVEATFFGGATLPYYTNDGSNIYVSSSSDYTISTYLINSQFTGKLTSYIDGGRCAGITNQAFGGFTSIQTASFARATSVDDYGFYNCPNLGIVNIPAVTTINSLGFNHTLALRDVYAPRLQTVGSSAFGTSGLTRIQAPNITTIGNYAFYDCPNLQTFKANKATSVGMGAFQQSGVTYIELKGLTGANALGGDTGYTGVFSNVPQNGTILVPVYYQTNNAGAVDADLAYLQTQGWIIVWS